MPGIIWLASYPKSGNTWLRLFLANLYENPDAPLDINRVTDFHTGDMEPRHFEKLSGKPVTEMTDAEINRLRPRVAEDLSRASLSGPALVKTHNALVQVDGVPVISPAQTIGAIYIVRNPFDMVISLADHYGSTIDDSIEAIASEAHRVRTGPRAVCQHLGSWHNHVDSWVNANGLPLLFLKYENMTANPVKAFGAVMKFLNLPRDQKRLKKAIRFSSFSTVSEQEKRAGFVEKSVNSDRFFRSGKVGTWRQALSESQIDRIRQTQWKGLVSCGYMKEDGSLRV